MKVISLGGFKQRNERSEAITQASHLVEFLKHNTHLSEKGTLRMRTVFLDMLLNENEISVEKTVHSENILSHPLN